MTKTLSPEEHERIAGAIRKAEAATAGEIVCVVARSSDSYFFSAGLVVLASMLGVSMILALLLESWWLGIRLPVFVGAQLLASLAALGLVSAIPALRFRLAPPRWQFRRAHENAQKQFLARNIHLTAGRTGVLIFVSLAERYAEIVADAGINEKVPQDVWNKVIADLIDHARQDRLADGFVAGVESVAALLAGHFPRQAGEANELADHLVEL